MLALAQLRSNKWEAGLDAEITEAEADALVKNMRVRKRFMKCSRHLEPMGNDHLHHVLLAACMAFDPGNTWTGFN